jgi:CheY-like chemotaxis protein
VLLAEDNAVNQKVATAMLEKAGAQVTIAPDGDQAVAWFERAPFDLILMDCQMPGTDGFAATARIRALEQARGGRIPIVAMTANALIGDRERCLAAGMDDYLTKPVNRERLLGALVRWSGTGLAPSRELATPRPAAQTPPALLTPSDQAGPELDRERFNEMTELLSPTSAGFYTEILARYVQEAQERVSELPIALEKRDLLRARALAHVLVGASRNLGFIGLAHIAEQIELLATKQRAEAAIALLPLLVIELKRIVAFARREDGAPAGGSSP